MTSFLRNGEKIGITFKILSYYGQPRLTEKLLDQSFSYQEAYPNLIASVNDITIIQLLSPRIGNLSFFHQLYLHID